MPPSFVIDNTDTGPGQSSLVTIRYKEWWADHPTVPADSLQIGTTRPGGGNDERPVEVITPAIAPVSKGANGIHLFDEGSDGTTDLTAPVPFFFALPFQTGADVFMPASAPPDGTITVHNRKIKVVRESENVIWFEFAALCEGPRSPADYIAIASEYQSVVISNVPVLHDTADNAARRFISVIDEFYDRGVNVIVSAAAEPADLYKGEKLKFEFQRTASRLIEMQSRDYLTAARRAPGGAPQAMVEAPAAS